MGGFGGSTLGLIMRISADSTQAESALSNFVTAGTGASATLNSTLGTVSRSLTGSFGMLGTAVGGVATSLGSLAGIVFAAGESWAKYAEHVGNASRMTGLATQTMSTLYTAGRATGTSMGNLDTMMIQFTRNLGNLDKSTSSLASKALADLGLSLQDVRGKGVTADEAFQKIIERLATMPDGVRKSTDAMDLFRRSGSSASGQTMGFVATLDLLGKHFDQVREMAQNAGLMIDKEGVQKAREFQETLRLLGMELGSVAMKLGEKLVPYLTSFGAVLYTLPQEARIFWQTLVTLFDRVAAGLIRIAAYGKSAIGVITGNFAALDTDMLKLADSWSAAADKSFDATDKMMKNVADAQAAFKSFVKTLATELAGEGGSDTSGAVGAVKTYTDKLSDLLQRTREDIQITNDEAMPAKQRIMEQYQRNVDAANRELQKDKELYANKKITLDELKARENEYTQTVQALVERRIQLMNQETGAEMLAFKEQEDALKDQQEKLEQNEEHWREMASIHDKIVIPSFNKLNENMAHAMEVIRKYGTEIHALYGNISVAAIAADPIIEQNAQAMRNYGQAARAAGDDMGILGVQFQRIQALHQQGMPIMQAAASAFKIEGDAAKQAAQSEIAANVEAIGSRILGRKTMAVVEAAVQTAEGFGSLAVYDFWGAAQHFTSAAMWGLVAGEGGSKRGSAGGAGGAGGTSRDRGGAGGFGRDHAPGYETVVGGAVSGGAGAALFGTPLNGNLTINIMGDREAAQWVGQKLQQHANNGGMVPNATRPAPVTPGMSR